MKHFLIYTNPIKDPGNTVCHRVQSYLEKMGQRVSCIDGEDREACLEGIEDASCMIVLGGDGTMLRAAWDAKKTSIPLIGVNLGTLGYLTEIDPESPEFFLDQLIEGTFETESRMMLIGKVFQGETKIWEEWALNDVIISRSGPLEIIRLKIYVNGQFLRDYHADGIMLTTPTGSTGYNLSAGGPIVEPNARLILLTPICPHTINSRSIILSPEDQIEIEIPEGRDGEPQKVQVSVDGAHHLNVETGDRIQIGKSEKTTDILRIGKSSFLEVLQQKMKD